MGKEADRLSPEQQGAYRRLAGFFGGAEKEYPAAAKQLVNVVGGLVGEQQTTERELQEGIGNVDVGLALIGDWLKEAGADGFEVKLGFGGGAKKAIGRTKVKFPTVSDLIRVSGRVDVDLRKQIPPLLSSFSRQIRGGLDVGLSSRQIVGGLVAESVGSRLSVNGSANLRQALNNPLVGHFEWIREALGVADMATQPGFTAKGVAPAKIVGREEATATLKKAAEAELTLTEKVFVAMVEDLVDWEEAAGVIDRGKLQKAFENMRLQFGGLPTGGHFRAKVTETVMGQLGDEGEKMRKARKSDEQIFEEWLKRVFIPLYRRAAKK